MNGHSADGIPDLGALGRQAPVQQEGEGAGVAGITVSGLEGEPWISVHPALMLQILARTEPGAAVLRHLQPSLAVAGAALAMIHAARVEEEGGVYSFDAGKVQAALEYVKAQLGVAPWEQPGGEA